MKGLFTATCIDLHIDAMKEGHKAQVEEVRANEARRDFLKYIFHEVRTPLNSLTMGIDLLKSSDQLTESDREAVTMMCGASNYMNETLEGVLNMQKLNEGKFELDVCPFIMRDCVTRAINTYRKSAQTKRISIVKDLSIGTYVGAYLFIYLSKNYVIASGTCSSVML